VEGAELSGERREMVVEEEEVAEVGEESELGGEGRELVGRRVEEGEVDEAADGGGHGGEGVVWHVERREERVAEQLGRDVLEHHPAHVNRRPSVALLLLPPVESCCRRRRAAHEVLLLRWGRRARRHERRAEHGVHLVDRVSSSAVWTDDPSAAILAVPVRAVRERLDRAVGVRDGDGRRALPPRGEVCCSCVVMGGVGLAGERRGGQLLLPVRCHGPAVRGRVRRA
jgi:hypothetical protein